MTQCRSLPPFLRSPMQRRDTQTDRPCPWAALVWASQLPHFETRWRTSQIWVRNGHETLTAEAQFAQFA